MPRKSTAALSMSNLAVDGRPARLKPPASLSKRERELFLHIVNTNQPEHFRPSDIVLLCRYVESAALAEAAAIELRKGAVVDGKASAWLVPQEKAVRALTALSARLRLSPQSRSISVAPLVSRCRQDHVRGWMTMLMMVPGA